MAALEQVFVLFLLIIVGYVTKKLNIITNEINHGVSNLVLYVALPAFLITAMNFSFSPDVLAKSGKLAIISACIYALVIGISYWVPRLLDIKGQIRDIYQFVIVFSNVGFMGYPIVKAILGDEGVFYAAIYNLPFNVLIWTIGIHFLIRDSKRKNNSNNKKKLIDPKIFINPGVISIIIGFSLFLFSIELPYAIYRPLEMLGNLTTPLSMLFIGFILADVKTGEIFTDKRVFILSAIRLLVLPITAFIILSLVGLKGYLIAIPVIITAMPGAANSAIMASKFGNDYEFASKAVFISTLFSIGTIPLIVMLIG